MELNSPMVQDGAQDNSNLNLRHYWHIVLERRWLVVTSFIVVLILCALYLTKATRIYQATTRLEINREPDAPINFNPQVMSIDMREQDYLQTQYKNLQSRSLLESVIHKLDLDKDPRYAKELDRAYALSKDITIVPIRLSRLVDVKVEHSDAKKAQLIANAIADTFIDQNLIQRLGVSGNAVVWLNGQVAAQKKALENAENALQQYKITHNTVSFDEGENISRQALLQAQQDLSIARTKALQAEQTVKEVENKLKSGSTLDTIPEIANNLTIQKLNQELIIQQSNLAGLLKHYKSKHPLVSAANEQISILQRKLNEESQKTFEVMKFEANSALAKQRAIAELVSQMEEKNLELSNLRIQYDALKREAKSTEDIYKIVFTKLKETEMTNKMKSNNMRVVDYATTPFKPVKPRILLTILLGIFGGLGVSLGLAFFVSFLDDSIKSQDDVENFLRLPFLGYIPNIKTNSVVERDLQAHLHPQSNAAEGFRTIRATVSLTHKPDKFRVLSVTSTIPSEGKSLVASNLAIVTAQTGLRTLLVDADLRRPSVHKAYQLHSPTGLSSYLTEEVKSVDELIHTSDIQNLDVVCCGAVPANPSELIGSKQMALFLEAVRSRYDRVVLDCPPISAVSDPLVISAMADGIIFVTKFNKIRREHARKSVQRVQNAGIHVIGVVLNDIDFEGKDSYYYSYYYYQNRYYASHYKNKAKTPADKSSKKEENLAKS